MEKWHKKKIESCYLIIDTKKNNLNQWIAYKIKKNTDEQRIVYGLGWQGKVRQLSLLLSNDGLQDAPVPHISSIGNDVWGAVNRYPKQANSLDALEIKK